MKEKLIELYLDWFNNYVSVGKIADFYGFDHEDMVTLLKIGGKYHHEKIELDEPVTTKNKTK